jgi:hypothetical protein
MNIKEGANEDLKTYKDHIKVVDKITYNDYTMYLLKFVSIQNCYQIGMTYKDVSFMKPNDQKGKSFKNSIKIILQTKKVFISKLKEWILSFDEIYFGSYDYKKADTYYSIIKKLGFKVTEPEYIMSAKVFRILNS